MKPQEQTLHKHMQSNDSKPTQPDVASDNSKEDVHEIYGSLPRGFMDAEGARAGAFQSGTLKTPEQPCRD